MRRAWSVRSPAADRADVSRPAARARPGAVPVAALLLAVAAACAGSGALRDQPLDRGESLAFEAPAERVYQVARTAVREVGLQIDQERREDDSTRIILASTLLTEDELAVSVRVVVLSTGREETRVTVLSRRTVPTEITFGRDPWADRIFGEMVPRLFEGGPGWEGGAG